MNQFADTYYQKASHLSDIGRWREAIKEAGLCLAIEPSHYRAICTISRAHYELGELDKALEFAGKAIAADPTQEWAYRLQSAVYNKQNKSKKQLEHALEAIKQEPQSVLALQNLAYAQLARRKFKEARQTAEKLRQISPDSIEAHKTFGYVEFNDSNFVASEEHFRRALKIEATNYDTLNMLGEVLMKQYEKTYAYKTKRKILNEAIDCFRQAIILNPTLPEAKKNLKDAHFKSLSSHPIFLFPLLLTAFLIAILILNRKSSEYYRPELLNLDNKQPEVLALNIIAGICFLAALYWVAAAFARKGLSESNQKIIEISEPVTISKRIGYVFWLLLSAYPLIFLISKVVTLNFAIFGLFNLLDWLSLSAGIVGLIINCILILPYLFTKKST